MIHDLYVEINSNVKIREEKSLHFSIIWEDPTVAMSPSLRPPSRSFEKNLEPQSPLNYNNIKQDLRLVTFQII